MVVTQTIIMRLKVIKHEEVIVIGEKKSQL